MLQGCPLSVFLAQSFLAQVSWFLSSSAVELVFFPAARLAWSLAMKTPAPPAGRRSKPLDFPCRLEVLPGTLHVCDGQ